MKRLSLTIGLCLLLLTILAACSPSEAAPTAMPVAQLSLTATDIAYDTNRLEVLAGQPVRLTLHNEGALEHDFSIMEIPHAGEVMAEEAEGEMGGHDMSEMEIEPEVHVSAPIGGSNAVEFTPSTPGQYEFFCTVEGHKEAGMVGTLDVRAP